MVCALPIWTASSSMPATVAPVPALEQAGDAAVDASGAARTATGISSRVSAASTGTATGTTAFHRHARAYDCATRAAVPLIPAARR
jgi:hypothetical protein